MRLNNIHRERERESNCRAGLLLVVAVACIHRICRRLTLFARLLGVRFSVYLLHSSVAAAICPLSISYVAVFFFFFFFLLLLLYQFFLYYFVCVLSLPAVFHRDSKLERERELPLILSRTSIFGGGGGWTT